MHRRTGALPCAVFLACLSSCALAFVPSNPPAIPSSPSPSRAAAVAGPAAVGRRKGGRGRGPALFVRNVDLPEAIIFYDVMGHGEPDGDGGWHPLLKQCAECGTAAIVVAGGDGGEEQDDDAAEPGSDRPGGSDAPSGAPRGAAADLITLAVRGAARPPNPKDLLGAVGRTTIRPRPFGGSSGFAASRLADPSRPPLPARTVVVGPTERHSLAARLAGMRAVSFDEGDDLADAVLSPTEVQALWLEDLATPGSFWLNPPHPRDQDGNRVDPEQVVASLTKPEPDRGNRRLPTESGPDGSLQEGTDDESAEIRRILADLSPL